MRREKIDTMRVEEALEVIDQAAATDGARFLDIVSDRYESLKNVIAHHNGTRKRTVPLGRRLRRVAIKVDDHVRDEAWKYIGGIAAACLASGFLLGRTRR